MTNNYTGPAPFADVIREFQQRREEQQANHIKLEQERKQELAEAARDYDRRQHKRVKWPLYREYLETSYTAGKTLDEMADFLSTQTGKALSAEGINAVLEALGIKKEKAA